MGRRARLGSFVAVSIASTACLLTDLDDLAGGSPNGADAMGDAPPSDGAIGVDTGGAAPDMSDGAARCGLGTGGPGMIDAGTFCIDSTEVTQAQYFAFLQAKKGDTTGQDPVCAWNASYAVLSTCVFDPVGKADLPVVGVDWCDAVAMCRWAGKHLCGLTDGGTGKIADTSDPTHDEWLAACANFGDGLHTYPYGATYDSTACNDAKNEAGAALPVGSLSKCVGGLPGLYDMSGNVWELSAECTLQSEALDASPSADPCSWRGGSFGNLPENTTCGYAINRPRNTALCSLGFRCCAEH